MAIHEVRDESDGHRMWMNDEEYRKYKNAGGGCAFFILFLIIGIFILKCGDDKKDNDAHSSQKNKTEISGSVKKDDGSKTGNHSKAKSSSSDDNTTKDTAMFITNIPPEPSTEVELTDECSILQTSDMISSDLNLSDTSVSKPKARKKRSKANR